MDDSPNIDISGIESLKNIKDDQDVVKQRLAKMKEMEESVSQAVFTKVHEEYTDKLEALAQEAEPLKNKLRAQYAVLRNIMKDLRDTLSGYELEKEELEFRHTLGEFDEDHYQDQVKSWKDKQMLKQTDLEEAEQMRDMFLGVFDSEEDLEAPPGDLSVEDSAEAASESEEEADDEDDEDDEEALDEAELVSEDAEGEDESEDSDETGPEPVEDPTLGDETIEMAAPASLLAESAPPPPIEDLTEADDADQPEEADEGDLEDDLSGDFAIDLEDTAGSESLTDETNDFSSAIGQTDEAESDAEDETLRMDEPPVEEETLADDNDQGDVALPPPVSDATAMDTQPIQGDLAEQEALEGAMLPPLPPGHDSTLLMDNINLPADGEDDAEGTMIISNPKIISLNNDTEGQVIVLGMGTTSVGRSPDNDIHVTEDRVSRKHAQITFGPGGYAIYDLNSENGTYVNGSRVREHFLSDGDIVMVGTYKYLYRDR